MIRVVNYVLETKIEQNVKINVDKFPANLFLKAFLEHIKLSGYSSLSSSNQNFTAQNAN